MKTSLIEMKIDKSVYTVFMILYTLVPLLFTGCGATVNPKITVPKNYSNNECVVLLHGLGRTHRSMNNMQEALTLAGYHTVNLDYPSRQQSIKELATEYVPPVIDQCNGFNPQKIHFVTHSMGGIVVRMAIKQNRPEKLGRVVMLSPPNRGSEAVDHIKDRWFYSWYNGPAGQELTTFEDSVPNQLGPVDYPVGIITGTKHAVFDSWLLPFLRGVHDGKVSVEGAKLDGMTDFMVVPQSHSFIMNSQNVQDQTIRFLQQGYFSHDD